MVGEMIAKHCLGPNGLGDHFGARGRGRRSGITRRQLLRRDLQRDDLGGLPQQRQHLHADLDESVIDESVID